MLPGLCLLALAGQPIVHAPSARDEWSFKFRKFVIGAWWGPNATDAEMKLYKRAGFNVVMGGRYMQLDDYGDPDKGVRELQLAEKYGLGLLFDTYTKNDHPWGGLKGSGYDSHSVHHAASLAELKWLYNRIGKSRALIGFMIGDDQGTVSPRTAECTAFLHSLPKPHLFPWLCGWIPPDDLARHSNPICDPQIYPTLYSWGQSAERSAADYAGSYWSTSRQCQKNGVMFWPMFNAGSPMPDGDPKSIGGYLPSDSLMRFPAYTAVAYGADGIFYFCYSGGNISKVGPWETDATAKAALTRQYPVVQEINRRIGSWGPLVLGRTSTGLFGTAFGYLHADGLKSYGFASPAAGRLIEDMNRDLIVGILTKEGAHPMAMVVNSRTSKGFGDLPDRDVVVTFSPSVHGIRVLSGGNGLMVQGNTIELKLPPGGGQMLELEGDRLAHLCSKQGIYGNVGG
ncbi:MAG: hypothetical protein P4L46_01745 [Fimbriimonas sp.]|nr:hypothetical protein [Fimbriimonas sp.]